MINTTKIYLVENCYGDPNKVYIGKTKNCRKYPHKNKYGKNIKYSIIDEINSLNSKDWKPLECYWIEQFRSWGFDLQNKNKGGGGSNFHTNYTINKIIKSNIGKGVKPILQYDLEGNFIREWESSRKASIYLGKTRGSNISRCCNNIIKSAYGFMWEFKGDIIYKKINPKKNNNKQKWSQERRIKTLKSFSKIPKSRNKKISIKKSKKVYQYDCNNKLIKVYKSVTDFNKNMKIDMKNYYKVVNKNIIYKGFKYCTS